MKIWLFDKKQLLLQYKTSRGGAAVARWAHNPKVVGSIPAPATDYVRGVEIFPTSLFFILVKQIYFNCLVFGIILLYLQSQKLIS